MHQVVTSFLLSSFNIHTSTPCLTRHMPHRPTAYNCFSRSLNNKQPWFTMCLSLPMRYSTPVPNCWIHTADTRPVHTATRVNSCSTSPPSTPALGQHIVQSSANVANAQVASLTQSLTLEENPVSEVAQLSKEESDNNSPVTEGRPAVDKPFARVRKPSSHGEPSTVQSSLVPYAVCTFLGVTNVQSKCSPCAWQRQDGQAYLSARMFRLTSGPRR